MRSSTVSEGEGADRAGRGIPDIRPGGISLDAEQPGTASRGEIVTHRAAEEATWRSLPVLNTTPATLKVAWSDQPNPPMAPM